MIKWYKSSMKNKQKLMTDLLDDSWCLSCVLFVKAKEEKNSTKREKLRIWLCPRWVSQQSNAL